jgi:DNA-binding LacI/PurR family transcriptional regulator
VVLVAGFAPTGVPALVDRLFARAPAPTALLAPNDLVAVAVVRALHEGGRRVPGDVSVVGFDDIPVASYVVPALTTVAIPTAALGRAAVEALLGLLAGRPAATVVLPCELRVRESTSAFVEGRE